MVKGAFILAWWSWIPLDYVCFGLFIWMRSVAAWFTCALLLFCSSELKLQFLSVLKIENRSIWNIKSEGKLPIEQMFKEIYYLLEWEKVYNFFWETEIWYFFEHPLRHTVVSESIHFDLTSPSLLIHIQKVCQWQHVNFFPPFFN